MVYVLNTILKVMLGYYYKLYYIEPIKQSITLLPNKKFKHLFIR